MSKSKTCVILAWLLVIACIGNLVQICYISYQKGKTFTPGTCSECNPGPINSGYGRYISISKPDNRFWYFYNGSMEVIQTGHCEINDTTCVFYTDDGSYYGYAYLYGGAKIRAILGDGSKLILKKHSMLRFYRKGKRTRLQTPDLLSGYLDDGGSAPAANGGASASCRLGSATASLTRRKRKGGAFLCKRERGGPADAAGGACDEHCFSVHPCFHFTASFHRSVLFPALSIADVRPMVKPAQSS